MDKSQLRKQLSRARAAISEEQRIAETSATLQHLVSYITTHSVESCGLYSPISNELSTLEIATMVQHITWALPVTHIDDSMTFVKWQPGDHMTNGRYNISEPVTHSPVIPQVVITPLLGVDEAGYRLGFGKGFYDRYFSAQSHRLIHRIGVAFTCQMVPNIPHEAHDTPLHGLITADGYRVFPSH